MTNENKNNEIKVIGIDPAPSTGSTIYDGKEFHNKISFEKLEKYLENLKSNKNKKVLICWDAPLINQINTKELYYFRPIEKELKTLFYDSKNKKINKSLGVSIMSFASCPHWTITRYLLGLPRFSKFDCENIPFNLITNDEEKSNISHSIVEVHPAVGIYAWINEFPIYKNEKSVVSEIWGKLLETNFNIFKEIPTPKDDDQLDAAIAYVLGTLWTRGDQVKLVGNKSGAMLIPNGNFLRKLGSKK